MCVHVLPLHLSAPAPHRLSPCPCPPQYAQFATDAPGYGALVNSSTSQQMFNNYYKSGGCEEQEEACYGYGTNVRAVSCFPFSFSRL